MNVFKCFIGLLLFINSQGNAQVVSTLGLENLTSITGDLIISNTEIINLDGFISLNQVTGDVIIKNNNLLTNYCGLKNLFENGSIGGTVTIEGNQIDLDVTAMNFSSCTSLSTNNPTIENILIFPNPVTEQITISYSEKLKSIAIYNALGKLIVFKDINLNIINLTNLSSGIYTVKGTFNSNKTFVKKLIKK